ncbi:MAG: UDP-N-acetylglucosamine 2-epimerase [Nitrososphaeraceae archaeon]
MSVRTDADSSYSLSAYRGYDYVLKSLRKSVDIKEIWVVEIGGSFSKEYNDTIEVYNGFSFTDGNEIMEKLNPDLVVSSDYEYLHRSILKAAAYRGIPTVDIFYSAFGLSALNEGYEKIKIFGRLQGLRKNARSIIRRYIFLLKTLFHAGYNFRDLIRTIIKDFYLPLISWLPRYRFGGGDLNIVSTPEWVDLLIRNGIDKNKIVVVGDISMDPIYDKLMYIKNKTVDKDNNTITSKTEILVITAPMAEHGLWTQKMQEEAVTTIVRGITEQFRNDANLRIKIHPTSETIGTYRQLLDAIDPSIDIIQKADLFSLANKSDVVISFGSSSALFEPLLLGKPLYIVNIFNEEVSKNLYLKEKVAIECRTIDELITNIKNGISSTIDPNRIHTFIEKYTYKFDGKCSERAAKHIISLLDNRLNIARSS